MPTPPISSADLQAALDAVAEHGSVSAAARALGLNRVTFINRLRVAQGKGLGAPASGGSPNMARWRPFAEIVAARKAEFGRVKDAGDGRKLHTVHMADDGPYCLIALGDPHLDSPGTDLNLWERWIGYLDADRHVFALLLGDWLDNWVGKLQFLYGASETPAPEGWILLQGYLDQIAPHSLASVSGNHDDWSGYTDLLSHLMSVRGVLHRNTSLRVALTGPNGRAVSIGMRHRFSGRSQWNPAHAVMKAAQMGWRDTLLVGGDKHISGDGLVRDPDTGKLTWAYQVAAFKVLDDYGDQLGLRDQHVSPAVAFVVDPRRADTDPQLVTAFHDPAAAVDYLNFLRRS